MLEGVGAGKGNPRLVRVDIVILRIRAYHVACFSGEIRRKRIHCTNLLGTFFNGRILL